MFLFGGKKESEVAGGSGGDATVLALHAEKISKLYKRSRHLARWRERWCVLTSDSRMLTFKSDDFSEKPTEIIDLELFYVKPDPRLSTHFRLYRKFRAVSTDPDAPLRAAAVGSSSSIWSASGSVSSAKGMSLDSEARPSADSGTPIAVSSVDVRPSVVSKVVSKTLSVVGATTDPSQAEDTFDALNEDTVAWQRYSRYSMAAGVTEGPGRPTAPGSAACGGTTAVPASSSSPSTGSAGALGKSSGRTAAGAESSMEGGSSVRKKKGSADLMKKDPPHYHFKGEFADVNEWIKKIREHEAVRYSVLVPYFNLTLNARVKVGFDPRLVDHQRMKEEEHPLSSSRRTKDGEAIAASADADDAGDGADQILVIPREMLDSEDDDVAAAGDIVKKEERIGHQKSDGSATKGSILDWAGLTRTKSSVVDWRVKRGGSNLTGKSRGSSAASKLSLTAMPIASSPEIMASSVSKLPMLRESSTPEATPEPGIVTGDSGVTAAVTSVNELGVSKEGHPSSLLDLIDKVEVDDITVVPPEWAYYLPIPTDIPEKEIFNRLRDGVIFALMLNAIVPDCVDLRYLNVRPHSLLSDFFRDKGVSMVDEEKKESGLGVIAGGSSAGSGTGSDSAAASSMLTHAKGPRYSEDELSAVTEKITEQINANLLIVLSTASSLGIPISRFRLSQFTDPSTSYSTCRDWILHLMDFHVDCQINLRNFPCLIRLADLESEKHSELERLLGEEWLIRWVRFQTAITVEEETKSVKSDSEVDEVKSAADGHKAARMKSYTLFGKGPGKLLGSGKSGSSMKDGVIDLGDAIRAEDLCDGHIYCRILGCSEISTVIAQCRSVIDMDLTHIQSEDHNIHKLILSSLFTSIQRAKTPGRWLRPLSKEERVQMHMDFAEAATPSETRELLQEVESNISWLRSLIPDEYIVKIDRDLCDGILLLRVVDRIAAGSMSASELTEYGSIVDWGKVKMTPKNQWDRNGNCNTLVDILQNRYPFKGQIKLVGIDGTDIAQGKIRVILTVVGQLQRFHTIKTLSDLRFAGRSVSDVQIRNWANQLVVELSPTQLCVKMMEDLYSIQVVGSEEDTDEKSEMVERTDTTESDSRDGFDDRASLGASLETSTTLASSVYSKIQPSLKKKSFDSSGKRAPVEGQEWSGIKKWSDRRALSSGLFFYDILACVDPSVIVRDYIHTDFQINKLGGITKQVIYERKMSNIMGLFTLIRKMGGVIFIKPRDVIQCKPQATLTMAATILALGLRLRSPIFISSFQSLED